MNKSKKVISLGIVILLLSITIVTAQKKHSKVSMYKSYKGLIMAGYQGWFNAPQDGAGRGWNHYVARGKFEPGNCKIDLWPDVSEYEKTYITPFQLENGKPASLFSSYDASTVDVHFKWMRDYGVDGVFVQRFIGTARSKVSLNHNDRVLDNALKSSDKYKRAIALMYDLSGMRDADTTMIMNDWKHVVDSLKLTNRGGNKTYLHHNGKPLVAVWGVGFNGRPYSLKATARILDFLKNDPVYGGCALLLGVPSYWRDLSGDATGDSYLHEILRKADIVQPWFVGRYNQSEYPVFKERITQDITWCKSNKLDYVPVIFPGFTWHNMYPKNPSDQIPRDRGKFYWSQLAGAISQGAEMIYVAMFDEVDEGTAIFKIAKNPPVGKSVFVKFEEDIPADYYLSLTGYGGKMLRKEVPFQEDVPSQLK